MFVTFDLQISFLEFCPKEIIFDRQMSIFVLCQVFYLFKIMQNWKYPKDLKITKRLVVVQPCDLMLSSHQKDIYKKYLMAWE